MKPLLTAETLEEAALLLNDIDPAFIEKDWYAVELLKCIHDFLVSDGVLFQCAFTGGTSLSKAHQIIERFSEDLDFLVFTKHGDVSTKRERREFRNALITHINADDRFSTNPEHARASSRNNSKFFRCLITYPSTIAHDSIRDTLQLEMTFEAPRNPIVIKPLQSLIQALDDNEATRELGIACTNPLEIAGDKLSALCWRVLAYGKTLPMVVTFIRHLHDLTALKPLIDQNIEEFNVSVNIAMTVDSTSRGRRRQTMKDLSNTERLTMAVDLSSQEAYRNAYQRYVTRVSYQDEDRRISYDDALNALKSMIAFLR